MGKGAEIMNKTSIEWTDYSVNCIRARKVVVVPGGEFAVVGQGHYCEKVSPGCKNCYASRLQSRFGMPPFAEQDLDGNIENYLDEKVLAQILRHRKPARIFWNDMSDAFGSWVPDEWLDRMFAVMALTPHLTHQVLTKRSKRMRGYFANPLTRHRVFQHRARLITRAQGETAWPLPNLWLGVSVEDQKRADERIPDLLATPAAVRFLSCEPLLGNIDLSAFLAISLIITGGESGNRARPMHPDWARSIRDQCVMAGVPFFFKQWGTWEVASHENCHFGSDMARNGAKWVDIDGTVTGPSSHGLINPYAMVPVGKAKAGRLLDGREWNELPEVKS